MCHENGSACIELYLNVHLTILLNLHRPLVIIILKTFQSFNVSGSERGHIETFMYKAEDEDFASSDASLLDKWVFDHVEKFFREAPQDKKLNEQLHQDRIIFLLHFLGLDTNGHAHKPRSQ